MPLCHTYTILVSRDDGQQCRLCVTTANSNPKARATVPCPFCHATATADNDAALLDKWQPQINTCATVPCTLSSNCDSRQQCCPAQHVASSKSGSPCHCATVPCPFCHATATADHDAALLDMWQPEFSLRHSATMPCTFCNSDSGAAVPNIWQPQNPEACDTVPCTFGCATMKADNGATLPDI